jgi:hypothetical protein
MSVFSCFKSCSYCLTDLRLSVFPSRIIIPRFRIIKRQRRRLKSRWRFWGKRLVHFLSRLGLFINIALSSYDFTTTKMARGFKTPNVERSSCSFLLRETNRFLWRHLAVPLLLLLPLSLPLLPHKAKSYLSFHRGRLPLSQVSDRKR